MPRWSDVIQYVSIEVVRDAEGFNVEEEVLGSPVFANRLAVGTSEFYQAAQNGIQLEKKFEVRVADYDNQQVLMYNGQRYRVERTYEKTDLIELTCKRFEGGVI